jgi:hypothetical protein
MSSKEANVEASDFRRTMRRLWRRNGLSFGGDRPGVSIRELVKRSESRNRSKRLSHFDLWNEIYDEYLSWFLSLLTVLYSGLKSQKRSRGRALQFFKALTILAIRIFADLLAIRVLCRAGFDVAAKTLARSTVEYIDTFVLIVLKPSVAAEFNRSDRNERSNAFWHKFISRGKIRAMTESIWLSRFGADFDAKGWDQWLYQYHGVLGMAVHPSFSGGTFSALALGSGSNDKWIGFLGERADISTDTFYHLVLHLWKMTALFPEFPFRNDVSEGLCLRYAKNDELHRHVKTGSGVLMALLVSIWDPKVNHRFFKEPDTSNIWPKRKSKSRTRRSQKASEVPS